MIPCKLRLSMMLLNPDRHSSRWCRCDSSFSSPSSLTLYLIKIGTTASSRPRMRCLSSRSYWPWFSMNRGAHRVLWRAREDVEPAHEILQALLDHGAAVFRFGLLDGRAALRVLARLHFFLPSLLPQTLHEQPAQIAPDARRTKTIPTLNRGRRESVFRRN